MIDFNFLCFPFKQTHFELLGKKKKNIFFWALSIQQKKKKKLQKNDDAFEIDFDWIDILFNNW